MIFMTISDLEQMKNQKKILKEDDLNRNQGLILFSHSFMNEVKEDSNSCSQACRIIFCTKKMIKIQVCES